MWRGEVSSDESEAVVRSDRGLGQRGVSEDGEVVRVKRCPEGRIDRIW